MSYRPYVEPPLPPPSPPRPPPRRRPPRKRPVVLPFPPIPYLPDMRPSPRPLPLPLPLPSPVFFPPSPIESPPLPSPIPIPPLPPALVPATVALSPGIQVTCPAPATSKAQGDALAQTYKNQSKFSPVGSRPNAKWHLSETTPKPNQQAFYCGNRPEIRDATIRQMCEGATGMYKSPYPYDRIGTVLECHRSGVRRGWSLASRG